MKPDKQTTIQTLLVLGKGQREIARFTGIDRKTIRGYQRKFAPANSPGVGHRLAASERCLGGRANSPTPATGPHVGVRALARVRRGAAEPQAQRHGDLPGPGGRARLHHGYNSVKRFVATLRSREPEQFDRLEFAPGEEAQLDYGEGALT